MKRKILDKEEAIQILSPFSARISQAVSEAFNHYVALEAMGNEQVVFMDFKNRTKAGIIHDIIEVKIKEIFHDEPQVQIGMWNGIFGLLIGDKLFIRFNKIDKGHLPSHYPTKQAKKFLNQTIIHGLPDEPTLLFVGYHPDKTWSKIKSIEVVCIDAYKPYWAFDLISQAGFEQLSLFSENVSNPEELNERRVKIKPEVKKKSTGTDNL